MPSGTFFSICGAPKAGTTSLHHYLGAYPEICVSQPKETDFFQHRYDRGLKYFESCFEHCQNTLAWRESSPGNMIHPEAPERIASHFPNARLIFVLRNSIERAYSQYLYGVVRGTDTPRISFSKLIRDGDDEWGRRVLELGLYCEQLARFEKHFPRDQMLIGLFQTFREDNEAFLSRILTFLEVDSSVDLQTSEQHNSTRYPRSRKALRVAYTLWEPIKSTLPERAVEKMCGLRSSVRDLLFQSGTQEKPPMKSKDRAYLREYYAEPNKRLEEWLNRDLSHWK
ncbi:hypothetical protein GGP81_003101 [Salinibacter ruber]|uniref:sulfotransferase family protein n=1 Tax=Salinibacter ruber TaxID=146919 RepID=UPI0024518FC2|nr:hypothetical protein [Salinibacter ruber]